MNNVLVKFFDHVPKKTYIRNPCKRNRVPVPARSKVAVTEAITRRRMTDKNAGSNVRRFDRNFDFQDFLFLSPRKEVEKLYNIDHRHEDRVARYS